MSEKKEAKAKKPEVVKSHRQTTREKNFEAARETAVKNYNADVEQNTVGANEGVEVRKATPVEVINPVRNPATGELEDDTRTLKQTAEEAVGAEESDKKSK